MATGDGHTSLPDKISLHEYSTFQYMLAPPSLACRVGDRITEVIFYDEPKQPQKSEDQHKVAMHRTGFLTITAYYVCCLLVLPSHILGMSRFVSAEDLAGEEGEGQLPVLRRFVYTYYCGLIKVETHHVRDVSGGTGAFRLVEYFDTIWCCVYAIMFPFCVLLAPLFLLLFLSISFCAWWPVAMRYRQMNRRYQFMRLPCE